MPISQKTGAKPVLLQLNNTGSWKTIAGFDASNDLDSQIAHQVAKAVCSLDSKARWRIVIDGSSPQIVLRHCDKVNGWRDA